MKFKEYNISDPVWSIKGFGLSRQNMGSVGTFVTCSYKDKHKNLVFPGRYYVETKVMLKRPTRIKEGVILYLCPFSEARNDGEETELMVKVKCKLAPFIPEKEWCLESQKTAPEYCRGCARYIHKLS